MTAMEDVALWHERDISHSSAERVILPDACALSDYIVRLSTRIVEGLRVKSENMAANIELHGGIVFSQQVLTALIVEAEWPRERAYRAVQALAARARDDEGSFRDLVKVDADIASCAVRGDDRTMFRRRALSRQYRRDLPASWSFDDNSRTSTAQRFSAGARN